MSETDTRHRILDAAEKLFADGGFAATSLRAITAAAKANVAAVNYHFGSKETLFREVFARRIGPINRERIERLERLERQGGDPPALEPILEAFLAPALRLSRDPSTGGGNFLRLMGRIYTEPGEFWQPVIRQFDEVKERFLVALRRALPAVPPVEMFWRMHFMVGVMSHTMADTHRLEAISGGLCDPNDVDGILERLVGFLAAGLRAPLPAAAGDAAK